MNPTKIICALLLLGLSFGTYSARADHIAGIDLSYTCTGNPNEYIFELKFFRDCTGIPITLLITPLYFENTCTGDAFLETLDLQLDESYRKSRLSATAR